MTKQTVYILDQILGNILEHCDTELFASDDHEIINECLKLRNMLTEHFAELPSVSGEPELTLVSTRSGKLAVQPESESELRLGLHVRTDIGTISAYANTEPTVPGIATLFSCTGKEADEIDVTEAYVPVITNGDLQVSCYEDCFDENVTHSFSIDPKDVRQALALG